jgi:hypothetical protein
MPQGSQVRFHQRRRRLHPDRQEPRGGRHRQVHLRHQGVQRLDLQGLPGS